MLCVVRFIVCIDSYVHLCMRVGAFGNQHVSAYEISTLPVFSIFSVCDFVLLLFVCT